MKHTTSQFAKITFENYKGSSSRLQLLKAIQLFDKYHAQFAQKPLQFSWEEIAFCKNDPKHQFGYTSLGRELKRFDSLCVRVYFCSQYFSECLLLAVLINRDKQFECKYSPEHDIFSMASKTRNILCTNVYLMKRNDILHFSREKKERRITENFLIYFPCYLNTFFTVRSLC